MKNADKQFYHTKREYFAVMAPDEIPDWFQYESRLTKPQAPKSWVDMEEGNDRDYCRSWHYGTCVEFPDHLQWYQTAWEDYNAKISEFEMSVQCERYFAWRKFYADELLKQLEL